MSMNVDLYRGFRQPDVIKALAEKIADKAKLLEHPLYIMEVCGGHTHTIMKYGLKQLLPDNIRFVHGPGCPVCIMPKERIDQAIALAGLPDVILVTLGDMVRVPGSKSTLAQCRAKGGHVEAVYDPMDVLKIARENPDKQVVYFAIGFETTTPMTALLVECAEQQQLANLYFHINHVLVIPAMNAVLADGQSCINAFIGPSHVSVITGAKLYQPIVEGYQVPLVVGGFEPVDVLESVLMLTEQAVSGSAELQLQYRRAASYQGNVTAQQQVDKVFTLRNEFNWRGLGNIPHSALKLKPEYQHRDAELKFAEHFTHIYTPDHKHCRCGDILKGLATPPDCKVFGKACTPNRPMGSCMVSSEGACNAYYRYLG
ncbi:hydrogenase metallocenter (NiFe) assembly protein HypD [Photobacterium marinum]|uniref:Hydrogenase maturation factor n=1 Tax=Photobacterium marinum TaxID=1056511 RepID=L8J532_9GAMM|nr:hydrogenase formation protein HypD [Photobacterium marinum]ELR63861.1 hydrogenase metallocenter (NiFe) assembly protein HypD [Photobacterium marinum]